MENTINTNTKKVILIVSTTWADQKGLQSEYFELRGQGTWFQAEEVFQEGRLELWATFETLNGG